MHTIPKSYFGKTLIRLSRCQCQENSVFLRNLRPVCASILDAAHVLLTTVSWVLPILC